MSKLCDHLVQTRCPNLVIILSRQSVQTQWSSCPDRVSKLSDHLVQTGCPNSVIILSRQGVQTQWSSFPDRVSNLVVILSTFSDHDILLTGVIKLSGQSRISFLLMIYLQPMIHTFILDTVSGMIDKCRTCMSSIIVYKITQILLKEKIICNSWISLTTVISVIFPILGSSALLPMLSQAQGSLAFMQLLARTATHLLHACPSPAPRWLSCPQA